MYLSLGGCHHNQLPAPAENRNQPAYKVAGEYKRNPGFEFIVKLTRTKKQNHLDSLCLQLFDTLLDTRQDLLLGKRNLAAVPHPGDQDILPRIRGQSVYILHRQTIQRPPFQNFNLPLEYPHNVICHVCPWRLPHCNCA